MPVSSASSARSTARILFTCGRESFYTRNDVILRALHARYQVTEVTDSRLGSLTARNVRLLPRLISQLLNGDHDLAFVGFYGYLLMPWVRLLNRHPIVFDAFVSNYDTLCLDRQRLSAGSIPGRLTRWLDTVICRMADKVVLDTEMHKSFFAHTFDLPDDRLDHLYVGCNEDMFFPRAEDTKRGEFRVLHYSTYLPLHGVDHIVEAARLLNDRPGIRFRFIGAGMSYDPVRRLAEQAGLTNVDFLPLVDYTRLPDEIAAADLCLGGPFGDTPKAKRVIPGKIFQFLAMARPVIAADTPGNRELLAHNRHAYLVPAADGQALARAIGSLHDDAGLRQALAEGGHELYRQECSEAAVRRRLYGILDSLL